MMMALLLGGGRNEYCTPSRGEYSSYTRGKFLYFACVGAIVDLCVCNVAKHSQQALTVYIFGAAIATMRQILASCLLCILATYPEVRSALVAQPFIRSRVLVFC